MRLGGDYNQLYETKQFSNMGMSFNLNGQFKNFWSLSADFGGSPRSSNDFFEARVADYVFTRPENYRFSFNLRTDSRKIFRVNGRLRFSRRPDWDQKDLNANGTARIRIGNRAEISHSLDYNRRLNERGYTTRLRDDAGNVENVIFGVRDVRNLTNTLNASYIFTNRMGVTFRARHYWSRVVYNQFFELTQDRGLINTDYTGIDVDGPQHDRNFNTFNIDMEYNWQLAPGSEIRAIWKRQIRTDGNNTDLDFFDNFSDTFGANNFDTITIRFVYFIDYLNVKNLFTRK